MRIVGLVAGVADHTARVSGGFDLRKALRFRLVLLMAPAAQVGDVGQLGNVRRRVGGMLRQRAVARFTGHVQVFASGRGLGLVRVTKNAGILSGESDRVRADEFERAGPVVPILAECLGDDGATDGKEDSQSGDQDDSRPGQMSGIAKQLAQHCPLFRAGVDPPGVDAKSNGNKVAKRSA